MEFSSKILTLLSAVLLTGLSAGLFYAWQVSVIPGTRNVSDLTYLQSMQAINRAILNPAFYLIFLGSPLVLTLSTVQQLRAGIPFWCLVSATVVYVLGTFGVTIFGNVPLNDALDTLQLADLSDPELLEFRKKYEQEWNRLHIVRTMFAVLAFLLALLASFNGPQAA